MADLNARMERVIEEMTGNESLLQMLDTKAATEMLNWGIATAKSVISKTNEPEDFAADLALLPRLKALRQSMRSIGNWAAGKYTDSEDLIQLRQKLLEHLRTIFGEKRELPTARQLDELLSQAGNRTNNPHELILKFQDLLEQRG